jgi:hypothetical protein
MLRRTYHGSNQLLTGCTTSGAVQPKILKKFCLIFSISHCVIQSFLDELPTAMFGSSVWNGVSLPWEVKNMPPGSNKYIKILPPQYIIPVDSSGSSWPGKMQGKNQHITPTPYAPLFDSK